MDRRIATRACSMNAGGANRDAGAALARRRRNGIAWGALLLLAGAAVCGAGRAHAGPVADAVHIAQAGQGAAGQRGGSTGTGQWKHPESGATSPAGSGAVGPGDSQGQGRDAAPATQPGAGKRSGNDTGTSSAKGTVGKSRSEQGGAANSDKGPGHRGTDTKPGH